MYMNMQLYTSRIDTPTYQIGYFNHITWQSCIRPVVSSEISVEWKQDSAITVNTANYAYCVRFICTELSSVM
jgi:hypothetical protein